MKRLYSIVTKLAPWLVGILLALAGYAMWTRNAVVFDDAYITYRYADNLVAGHGPVYNPGERLEGYTNFSWMLLAAAGIATGQDPFEVTRTAGLLSHALMLFLIGSLCTRWLLQQGGARLWLLPVLALLVMPEGFAAMAGCGLETTFVACLLVAAGVLLYAGDFSRVGDCLALSAVLSLAVLTRMDSALSAAAAGAALLFTAWRAKTPFPRALLPPLRVGVPVALVLAGWTAFRLAYYGDLLPNTYYAKAADVLHVQEGLTYVVAFWRSNPQVLPLVILMLCALSSRNAGIVRIAIFAALTLLAELAYIVKVGGDFMEYRFAWQLYGLLVLAGVAGLVTLAQRGLAPALAVAAAAVSVAGQPAQLEKRFGMQSLEEMDRYAKNGAEIGKRLYDVIPRQAIIGTTLAGTMAYYSKLTIIDQWGLNDRFVARQKWKGPKLTRGHVKFAPLQYMRKRKVNLYIEHPVVCSCSHPCRENKPNVFVRLGKGRCLRTWYLTPTDALTAHFCAHSEDFVLNKVKCPRGSKPNKKAEAEAQIDAAEPAAVDPPRSVQVAAPNPLVPAAGPDSVVKPRRAPGGLDVAAQRPDQR